MSARFAVIEPPICQTEAYREPWRHEAGGGGFRFRAVPSRAGINAMLAVAAIAVFAFPLVHPFPLTDPDEGLHARIALEMVESGDWVTPRFLGQPFFDKPIVYFWATAGSLALFGHGEGAARLPALMFGVFGVAATWLLGRALFRNSTSAAIAALMLATSIHHMGQSQVVVHDIALVPFITLALTCFWCWDTRVDPKGRFGWGWIVAAGGCMGMACLTKGLLGLCLPGLIFTLYLIASRRLTGAKLAAMAAAGFVAVILATPWYSLVEQANPGYLRYFLLQRHLMGFLTSSQKHGEEPIWYYVPVLVLGGFPWIGYLPNTIRNLIYRRRRARTAGVTCPDPEIFLIAWVAAVFGFFSLAGSKLHTYVLPIYPGLVLLVGHAWRHCWSGAADPVEQRLWSRAHHMVCLVLAVAAPAVAAAVGFIAQVSLPLQGWLGITVVSASAVISLVAYRRMRKAFAFYALSGGMIGVFLVIVTVFLRPIGDARSHKSVAQVLRNHTPQTDRILWWHDRIGSAAFYGTGAELVYVASLEELAWRIQDRPVRLVVREKSVPVIEGMPGIAQSDQYQVAGHRVYCLR